MDEGFWLRAEKQTSGVGRRGRRWESPPGNLYCSTVVGIRPGDPTASSLSFVTSLAVYRTIRSFLPHPNMILKWPNDVVVSGAKICGILLDRVEDMVVVGIGVNIAVAPTVDERRVTCLKDEGAAVEVPDFLQLLASEFALSVRNWRERGLPGILDEWQKLAHPVGATITTSDEGGEKTTGEYAGLTGDGALRLRKADGTLIEIRAGDISIG